MLCVVVSYIVLCATKCVHAIHMYFDGSACVQVCYARHARVLFHGMIRYTMHTVQCVLMCKAYIWSHVQPGCARVLRHVEHMLVHVWNTY